MIAHLPKGRFVGELHPNQQISSNKIPRHETVHIYKTEEPSFSTHGVNQRVNLLHMSGRMCQSILRLECRCKSHVLRGWRSKFAYLMRAASRGSRLISLPAVSCAAVSRSEAAIVVRLRRTTNPTYRLQRVEDQRERPEERTL